MSYYNYYDIIMAKIYALKAQEELEKKKLVVIYRQEEARPYIGAIFNAIAARAEEAEVIEYLPKLNNTK